MELGERDYWHGTTSEAAVCIACEGFRIAPDFAKWGRWGTFRDAIYLTKSIATAACFGDYVARCRLRDGTQVLRLDGAYDSNTIRYLRREFGKDVLSPGFGKAIPFNKHLTRKELISLLNFVFSKTDKGGRKENDKKGVWHDWQVNLTRIRDQLRRHAFHAVGRSDDLSGIAVLDSSRVTCAEWYEAKLVSADHADLRLFDRVTLARAVREWLQEAERCAEASPEFCFPDSMIGRVRDNLQRFENRPEAS